MGEEPDYNPFVVAKGRIVLRLHGEKDRLLKVEKDKVSLIMHAIAEGWDTDISFAYIEGGLDIKTIFYKLEKLGRYSTVFAIKGNITVSHSIISRDTGFSKAQFSGNADFSGVQFIQSVSFNAAYFNGSADFGYAHFMKHVEFTNIIMAKPADFADVVFRENHVVKGLWNLFFGWSYKLEWDITNFLDFDTSLMNSSTNPYLKRYIEDEQWIASWYEGGWWREILFFFWELTSHCGRSIGLWALWSALIATVFAFVYRAFGPGSITFDVARLDGFQPDLWDYLYYSVVTFTTLGFGDIVPLTKPARFAVGTEVVLGYIMLGGLISIFANKLARRS